MLKEICNIVGVSGYESKIINWIYEQVKEANLNEIFIDNVGNLICIKRGRSGSKKIMISAHTDEVGFQVINKLSENKYKIKPLGNIKTWNAYQQRVITRSGLGIIKAYDEENLKSHNYENIYLEMLNQKDLNSGDIVAFKGDFFETERYYCGKALDNRLACAILIDIIKEDIETDADIYYVFTVQEEIGMRGARVAKTVISPDIIINIDTSAECEMNSLKLSEGVGIKISDSMCISSEQMVCYLRKIADKEQIKYQIEVSDCGTSELIITNELDRGCLEVGISIPCRYLHCTNSIISKDDYSECKKLLFAVNLDL